MYRLAKLGFSSVLHLFRLAQHETGADGIFRGTHATDVREYFRPNLWPNTPDILTEYSDNGGRPAFMTRSGSSRDPGRKLRDLRAGLRALRGSRTGAWQ